MRKLLLTFMGLALCAAPHAQTISEETRQDIQLTAGSYAVYPGPGHEGLTPPPKGWVPFYISHFGRHGSRYLGKPSQYNAPFLTLAKADSVGRLTPLGRDVMWRLDRIRHDAENRWGELTPLGTEQQRQIARRMFCRFPEAFADHVDVDARSTTVPRCILSMEYALMELLSLNPRLNVHHNATHRDMAYLNYQDRHLMELQFNQQASELYNRYEQSQIDGTRLAETLFNDTAYIRQHVNTTEFSLQLMLVAAVMQNTELGREVSLYDVFTVAEAFRLWKAGNARWYVGWGACSVNGAVQPYSQRFLLRRLIEDADRCVDSEKCHVQLRFGHDSSLLPLVCLLDINGLGLTTSNLELLEQSGWADYRIIPMAGNVQLVFYRREPHDRDVLLKVLLNEREATLPLHTDTPPYYKYSDFREYCVKKLEAYE